MEQKSSGLVLGVIIALVIGGAAGYWYGASSGYDKGYAQAETDVVKADEEVAKQATEDATKAANPFTVENPLENVEADPFEKIKKVLNPFE